MRTDNKKLNESVGNRKVVHSSLVLYGFFFHICLQFNKRMALSSCVSHLVSHTHTHTHTVSGIVVFRMHTVVWKCNSAKAHMRIICCSPASLAALKRCTSVLTTTQLGRTPASLTRTTHPSGSTTTSLWWQSTRWAAPSPTRWIQMWCTQVRECVQQFFFCSGGLA